jgi:hypothetical protein
MNQLPPLPLTLSQAIARQEGWYADTPNRPQQNNNPGDIEYGPFASCNGAIRSDNGTLIGGFAVYPDAETGFASLITLLKRKPYFEATVRDAISRYAPSTENNTEEYIENVCEWCDVTPETLVSSMRL